MITVIKYTPTLVSVVNSILESNEKDQDYIFLLVKRNKLALQ